ncbi:hypothetical protein BD309DRAFT_979315 [Dichomitus squalens]|uniref:Hemerythrin-like domain-containing protein n=1 Tax=Dichomitus squalens TaxID=114155 RepID=A0A4Q9P120_9APHY|nr:uncharacterized protein DICSQDRAFT_167024 [Dichomitus squalens LYAD-421 SS1]EJF64872.1 hypothetical protein DICSQDRAFT_167024 [Dichomitus squalens LYAD-421 SS1]TBU45706.1 hypothetical protein BD309DRAFT_979315 [Dichomitus squalens]TBU62775.1 hypothetical protein BD310DRAFT_810313 [Dichomitus squalens]
MATGAHLDVTEQIKLDHDNVRDLFQRYKQTADHDQKAAIANTLIREMAIHGDAEEISVYNDYAALGLGDAAKHNKEEHAEVKRAVYDADATSMSHDDYDAVLEKAVGTFLTHAKEEEDEQHPLIKQRLSAEDNDKLARAFLKARTTVPTRPHPWAPQSGGVAQKAAGVQGAFHDKVIETVEGREFVDLKYQHPSSY